MQDNLKYLPPQNLEFETSVLSTAIMYPQEMDIISDLINPTDFYRTAHGIIYETCLSLYNNNLPIDLMTVSNALKESDKLESIGGAAYLYKIADCPPCISVEHTCRKLAEKAALRRVISVCNEYVQRAFQDTGDAEKVLDGLQRDINKISIDGETDDVERVDCLMSAYLDKLEKLSQHKENITGHPTGFSLIDYMTCGWQDSDLIIIAARPSMGKTALALRFAMNMGRRGIPGLMFNLEMSKDQVTMRMAAMTSGVDSQRLRNGRMTDDDWQKVANAAAKVSDMPIFIDDTPSLHYNKIRRIARRHYKTHGIRYIFVDHLQLAKGDFPREPFNDTGSITGPLKALAKELKMPVFVLSQLNRDLEKRSNKRPMPSDLRNSGNIEQDADVVMFIYRDEVYNDDENNPNKGIAEIDIAKQRNGPTGMVKMVWREHCVDFSEMAQ